VDVRDIGEMASRALTASAPMGIQTLTGPEALTHSELAAHLSSATGHVIRFEDTPPAAFGEMLTGILPPWQAEGLLEDYAHYARGEAADISSAVPDALGRPARRFADFAAENAAAFGGATGLIDPTDDVEPRRFELLTSCLQSKRSTN